MSCGCGKGHDSGNCVVDILREIVEVQDAVVEDDCCDTSCEQSIRDVLGDTDNGNNGPNTVPVILYCKDCTPFRGFGVERAPAGGILPPMKASFIFRVKRVDKNDCAVLELLLNPAATDFDADSLRDPVDQSLTNLSETGICITVDLNCFCHVTCLPAITL